MKMKVSDFIATFLCAQQINFVFEMAGGMITHLLDSIYKTKKIHIISVHHEQAAAFAADGYARYTGKPGVAFATSGPGATNLLTGIGSCYFDSVPALFITGQVNTYEQKGNLDIRQLGFQETDIVSMARPITKKCYTIEQAQQIVSVLKEAYLLAMMDRPGPVLIDIPMNIQREEICVEPAAFLPLVRCYKEAINFDELNQLKQAIFSAKKPLIIAGRGILASQSVARLLQFITVVKVPIVTSLLAVDAVPYLHPLRVGFLGSYGNRWANLAIGEADLLIVLGSRLDIRQTGADIVGFGKNKTIFHIDCHENEINNRVKGCIPIVADVKCFLEKFINLYQHEKFPSTDSWLKKITQLKNQWPDTSELKSVTGINPNHFMHCLSHYCEDIQGFVVDVGNHQMWAAQSLKLTQNHFFMTSAGMGAMGFALPAAIGASFAAGKKPVVVIAGDGGFQLNIQELQTVVHHQLPLKLIILNNKVLGMIRQFQDAYFEKRYQSTAWGYSAPNFEMIGQAYGMTSYTISDTVEIEKGLSCVFADMTKPALLQVMISPAANAYPKIAFGRPITEMEPFVQPIAMEGT